MGEKKRISAAETPTHPPMSKPMDKMKDFSSEGHRLGFWCRPVVESLKSTTVNTIYSMAFGLGQLLVIKVTYILFLSIL